MMSFIGSAKGLLLGRPVSNEDSLDHDMEEADHQASRIDSFGSMKNHSRNQTLPTETSSGTSIAESSRTPISEHTPMDVVLAAGNRDRSSTPDATSTRRSHLSTNPSGESAGPKHAYQTEASCNHRGQMKEMSADLYRLKDESRKLRSVNEHQQQQVGIL
jgi:hypothetical protein